MFKIDAANLPYLLHDYAYVTLRIFFIGVFIYLSLSMIIQISQDLSMKMQAENDMLVLEISRCREDYYENKCNPHERVRALEQFCSEREKCMKQDPAVINKNSKIMAKLLAEIINDFFEPLSYKTIALVASLLMVTFLISECLLGRGRNQQNQIKKID